MRKLAALCVQRPVFATMIVMMLMVLGVDGYRKLGVDLFPKVELPTVMVTTTLRGASPEEVESQVSKRIEEAVNTVAGIDDLRSTSSEGISIVSIQFVLEKDQDEAAQEVRDKISRVLGQLPKDADPPIIEKLATDATPIINVVVSSDRDLRETTKLVDDRIKKNIESLNGVGQVRFVGDRQRQIQIVLDGERLYAYNLNIDQIRQQLALQNVEVPGGNIDQGRREVSLRTLGRVERPQDFERIIVANRGGQPIRVADIGKVIDGYEEPRSLARLDGRPAVALEVRKQSGTNTLEVIRTVKARIAELRTALPNDLEITFTRDQSVFIQESFNAVQEHLILGSIFAGLIVMLFIRDWRATLIASVAIPTSIISTYTLINAMGFTLNNITMLALTLMVGIVIDDAIVVLENIYKFMEEKHRGPVEAAIEGTRDIGLAVMATTFSLVIIFLPIAFMGGIVGRFMSSFGYTAAFAILVSMLVSFTMTPMLCSRFLKHDPSQEGAGSKDTFLFRWMSSFYRVLLEWSMRHRWVIVTLSLVIVYSTGPLFSRIGKDFLSNDDQSEFEVSIKTPPGSSLEGSDAVFKQMEEELKTLPGIRNIYTSIGADLRKQVDRGSILLELVPPKERKHTQAELMIQARAIAVRHRDLTTGVQPPAVFAGAADRELMFFLQGPDLSTLNKYATEIRDRLAAEGSTVDLESSYESGKPEIRVLVNRDKAADLNVSVASIATALRTLVGGDEQATTYREGDDRYDVMLRVDKQFRSSQNALNRLFVPSSSLGNVPVASVAALQDSTGPVQIERYNRQRQIMITGNVAKGHALSDLITLINNNVAGMNLPPEYRTGFVGKGKELGRAGASFALALLLSILFMYMILAAQFESFIDPVTILLALPLSVPFALLSLMLFHENYSIIYSSVGVLVLFGIVKKNSILQIDHIKNLRREGVPRMDAILRGCEDRLRPILMTTAALVAGMLPLAVGTGAGAATRRTVAIVVIGGQSMALLLTLLVTPVAYSLFDDLASVKLFSLFRRRRTLATTSTILLLAAFLFTPHAAAQSPVPLSLNEAVQTALRNNLEIEIERTNVASAYEGIRGARGYLDPTFRYSPIFESRNTPTSSALASPTGKLSETFVGQNFYFRKRTNWNGLFLHADFENTRQTTNNPFVSLSPYVMPRLIIGATLPLLRDRQIDDERATFLIRRSQAASSDVDFQLRVIDVIARVEQAYYDLVAIRADVDVNTESVTLAQEQFDRTKRMIDSGSVAPVELFAAEAELDRRKDTLYASQNLLTQLESILRQLVTCERDSDLWRAPILPTSDQRAARPMQLNEEPKALVDAALRQRGELKAITLRGETNLTQKEQALNQKKMQLSVTGAYVSTGLAGSTLPATATNPFTQLNTAIVERLNMLTNSSGLPPLTISSGGIPPGLTGGYGTSLSNLFGGSYSSFQGGITFDWTVRNNAAQSALAQTSITERRLGLERRRTEQVIEIQIRNALQSIAISEQRIQAAESSARAAKEKLDSETRLFQTGESTNFLVLTRQNEFSDSRRRVVVATLEFNKSVARFAFALGRTLETHSIQLK